MRLLRKNTRAEFMERSNVLRIEDHGAFVTVILQQKYESGPIKEEAIRAKQVMFATTGFYQDQTLSGLIETWASFAVCFSDIGPNTANGAYFETLDKFPYWSRQDNILYFGGEDIKVERIGESFPIDEREPLQRLVNQVRAMFFNQRNKNPVATHFGIWAATKDAIPIVGRFDNKSNIYYCVGCNGIGHSLMTYAASIMPGILGNEKLGSQNQKLADFMSPQRSTLR
jgi:glycine/D-amino acid oxidase-like deaminating enzyme